MSWNSDFLLQGHMQCRQLLNRQSILKGIHTATCDTSYLIKLCLWKVNSEINYEMHSIIFLRLLKITNNI